MWEELAAQKGKWIGGQLIDYGDSFDRAISGGKPGKTILKDIVLSDDAITFVGEDFDICGSRAIAGIVEKGMSDFPIPANGLAFRGYAGHEFHIIMKGELDGKSRGCKDRESGS